MSINYGAVWWYFRLHFSSISNKFIENEKNKLISCVKMLPTLSICLRILSGISMQWKSILCVCGFLRFIQWHVFHSTLLESIVTGYDQQTKENCHCHEKTLLTLMPFKQFFLALVFLLFFNWLLCKCTTAFFFFSVETTFKFKDLKCRNFALIFKRRIRELYKARPEETELENGLEMKWKCT